MKQKLFTRVKALQFLSLLGQEPFSPDRLIVTPLQSLFFGLIDTMRDSISITEAKGFYRNARLRNYSRGISDSSSLIVCVPQGIQAQDILWVLPECTVLFIGFAGNLSGGLKIGDIVEVTETLDEIGQVYRLKVTGQYPDIRCSFSPCLLGERAEECCRRGMAWKCHATEMETAALAAAAGKNGQQLTAWLLITDAPGVVSFWEVDESQRQTINVAQGELIATALNWIKKEEPFQNEE